MIVGTEKHSTPKGNPIKRGNLGDFVA